KRTRVATAALTSFLILPGCHRKPAAVSAPPVPATSAPTPPPAPRRNTETERRARQPSRPPASKPEPIKAPALGEIVSPETREQLLKDIDTKLERAQGNVAALHTRRATPEQARGVGRVEE